MSNNEFDEWYLADDGPNGPRGPYSLEDIVKAILAKKVALDEFVWSELLETNNWVRIYDVEQLKFILKKRPICKLPKKRPKGNQSVKKIRIEYKSDLKKLRDDNDYRRYPRCPISGQVIIHNQKEYTFGRMVDISEKGLFVMTDDFDKFKLGEHISVTIDNHEFLGTLNIKSIVINARVRHGEQGLGLYFLHVNPSIRRKIVSYVISVLKGHIVDENSAA